MLDENFFIKLEWEIIPDALSAIDNPDTRDFWCDGVTTSVETNDSKKFVNDNRYVILKAWVGQGGESEYELIVHFGPKSLSRYARDLTILECIPTTDASEWFRTDVQQKKIEIQLL